MKAINPALRNGTFPLHHETTTALDAPLDAAFAYLDDFRKLSAHMEKPSGMMMGSKMAIETDVFGGRAIGSKVRMHGKMMGMTLALEEVVTERQTPYRKAWNTLGARLVVIGQYRLGFELTPGGSVTKARIFIDYALPEGRAARWLGLLFAKTYARWCTERMASDAVEYFRTPGVSSMERWKES
jgi:uncharacterized membrane protein